MCGARYRRRNIMLPHAHSTAHRTRPKEPLGQRMNFCIHARSLVGRFLKTNLDRQRAIPFQYAALAFSTWRCVRRHRSIIAGRGCIEPLHGSIATASSYKQMGAFFAAIPSSVIRYARSLPVPWLSIQRFSNNRCRVMGFSGSSIALTQPRPRSCCMNCRSR